MSRTQHDILVDAAAASHKGDWPGPRSWYWTVDDGALYLRSQADRGEQIRDPAYRPLLLAEGAALHRARIHLSAAGWLVRIRRLPREYDDVIARVSYLGQCPPCARDRLLHRVLLGVRDRLPPPVGSAVDLIPAIAAATAAGGARLYATPPTQTTHLGGDAESRAYLIVYGDTDLAYDWLRGGEATSAAVLAAAVGGLHLRLDDDAATAAETLRAVLPGHGHPYAVLSYQDRGIPRCADRPAAMIWR